MGRLGILNTVVSTFSIISIKHVSQCLGYQQISGSCETDYGVDNVGTIEKGGYELLIDGVSMDEIDDGKIHLAASKGHTWQIRTANTSVTETGSLDFMIRASAVDGANISESFYIDHDDVAWFYIFNFTTNLGCSTGTATVRSSTAGDEVVFVAGFIDMFYEDTDVKLEIAVAPANEGLESLWYFSEYLLEVRNTSTIDSAFSPLPPSIPSSSPSAKPTVPPPKCGAVISLHTDPGITFTYQIYRDENNKVVFKGTLVYEGEAWISIGLSKNHGQMSGGEAIVGLPDLENSKTNPGIYDMTGYTMPCVNLVETKRQILFDHSIEQTDMNTTLTFSRYLQEPDLLPLRVDRRTPFLWAVGWNNDWAEHYRVGSFLIDLRDLCDLTVEADGSVTIKVDGSVTIEEDDDFVTIATDGKETMWQIHGMFAGLAWAVATPLAVVSSMVRDMFDKNGKGGVTWFNAHMYLNVLSVLLTVAAFAVAVMTVEQKKMKHFSASKPHNVIGLAVFVIASAQIIGGLLRPHINLGSEKAVSTKRRTWRSIHKVTGVALLGMGFYQIFSGFSLYANKYNTPNYSWIFGVWLGFITFVTLLYKVLSKRMPANVNGNRAPP